MSIHPDISLSTQKSVIDREKEAAKVVCLTAGLAFSGMALTSKGLVRLVTGALGIELLRRGLWSGGNSAIRSFSNVVGAGPAEAQSTITVHGDVEEIYRFWRDVARSPEFMPLVESVKPISETVSLWRMHSSHGPAVEFTSEIQDDEPGKRIGWKVVGSQLFSGSGNVEFESSSVADHVIVRFSQSIQPILSFGSSMSSSLLSQHMKQGLRNFKQLFEAGEIATTAGQPAGERSSFSKAVASVAEPASTPQSQSALA